MVPINRGSQLDRGRHQRRREGSGAPLVRTLGAIVYYIRRGEVIKIGTTTTPWQRFATLRPDEILAFEPGTVIEERMRHQQFRHLRCAGEHFRAEPELLEHIAQVRQIHGGPDPSWPTGATIEEIPTPGPKGPARKKMQERFCSQHRQPRDQCNPHDRHVHSVRCSDDLLARVEAAGKTLGLDRNSAIEVAMEEFAQAYGNTAAAS